MFRRCMHAARLLPPWGSACWHGQPVQLCLSAAIRHNVCVVLLLCISPFFTDHLTPTGWLCACRVWRVAPRGPAHARLALHGGHGQHRRWRRRCGGCSGFNEGATPAAAAAPKHGRPACRRQRALLPAAAEPHERRHDRLGRRQIGALRRLDSYYRCRLHRLNRTGVSCQQSCRRSNFVSGVDD